MGSDMHYMTAAEMKGMSMSSLNSNMERLKKYPNLGAYKTAKGASPTCQAYNTLPMKTIRHLLEFEIEHGKSAMKGEIYGSFTLDIDDLRILKTDSSYRFLTREKDYGWIDIDELMSRISNAVYK